MKLIDTSINRPTLITVIVILVIIFGVISLRETPIQMKPTVDKPTITVTTLYPSAAPQEVEEQITTPMEEKLKSVEHLKKLTSTSSEGRSVIRLEFEWGVDKDLASIDILKKINLVGNLPEDSETPTITAVTSDEEQPVFWMIIKSDKMSINELYNFADDFIKQRIERVSGVADIRVVGGQEREIQVILDFKELTARGITISQVKNAIKEQNRNARGGHIDQGKRRFVVRTVGLFESIEDIEDVIIAKNGSDIVYLKDIAVVKDSYKERTSALKEGGERAVAFGIRKKSGVNTIAVTNGIKEEMKRLSKELGPKGIRLSEAYDESDYIWDSINFVVSNLEIGAFLAAFVLIFFLKSLRSMAIIIISIPVSLIATFILIYLFDRSLNIISLAGLAFAVGMVVDNSIVVLENIFRHLEMGKSRVKASFDGTSEVWGAVLASTLTTLAVFLPVIFIKEEAGQLFKDIAIAISCAVGASLIISITVIPMLSRKWLKADMKKGRRGSHPFTDIISFKWLGSIVSAFFIDTVRWFIKTKKRKIALIAGMVVIFFLSLKLLPQREYLPTGNRNLILVLYKPHVGTNFNKTEQLADIIQNRVLAMKEVDHLFAVVSSNFNVIGMISRDEYKQQIGSTIQKINSKIHDIPGFQYIFATQLNLFTRGFGKSLTIEVNGLNLSKIEEYAGRIKAQVMQLDGVSLVRSSLETGNPEYQIKIDRERAADLNLSVRDIADIVETLVAGKAASLYKTGGKEFDITLKGKESLLRDEDDLKNITIYTPDNKRVYLGNIAKIIETTGPTKIDHIEQNRAITLTANIKDGFTLEGVMNDINERVLEDIRPELPYGYSVKTSGAADDFKVMIGLLSGSFILAVVIIYLLMSALFESFLYPIIIMFSIPLAAIGAILGIYLNGSELNVITMLGFIILSGIVVNNAILLIHQTLNLIRDKGSDPHEAIIEACRTRMRPVFMSTITTTFGTLPIAIRGGAGSELYSGLGTAIVGGLSVSTVFTLILVPVVFSLVMDFGKKVSKEEG
ncbi:MAG: efflux RND transporter permease subunit [Nitrospirota bacterium]